MSVGVHFWNPFPKLPARPGAQQLAQPSKSTETVSKDLKTESPDPSRSPERSRGVTTLRCCIYARYTGPHGAIPQTKIPTLGGLGLGGWGGGGP